MYNKRSYSAANSKPRGGSAAKKARTATAAVPAASSGSGSKSSSRKELEKLPPLEQLPDEPRPTVKIDPRAVALANDILKDVWGYSSFRLEQEAAITRLVCGGSALVVFPTGGGKSLVYQVPALAFDKFDEICGRTPTRGVTLVVSPLIALMKVCL
jgi:superfamily II DNA helicase RecQ